MTVNRIIAHVFQQPSLREVDEAAMEQLVADHPYFAAARLLLAQKVFQQTGNLHETAVKQALLYTGQPHHAYRVITAEQVLQEVETRVAPVIPDDSLPEEDIPSAAATAAAEVQEAAVLPASEETTAPLVLENTVEEPVALMQEEEAAPVAFHEEVIPVIQEQLIAGDAVEAAAHTTSREEVIPLMQEQPIAGDAVEAPTHTASREEVIPLMQEQPLASEAIETAPLEAVADYEPAENPAHTAAGVQPPDVESITASDANSDDEPESSGPIKIFPLAVEETADTELIFQPLYTDDYFAYKRLKSPEEADELSDQGAAEMKSFTSWLRQIKDNFSGRTSKDWYHQQLHRIYEEETEPEISETVEKMAMDSIVFNNDIVSETLAEIWIRQQQYGNAIKIYQKLSLLNPDKNAYFAQKILELKSLTDKNK
ncbi:hypothetical protein [Chitinophaga sp. 212800010-3]|uniref:hypothetical protein n=1 Tax=unclassified Chitinophaga TaxID=2619133 RepID=UPI002DF6ECC8|nr:TPR-REGION domain-containing protein [Chitinophaga sp. 212800010-3]